MDEITFKKRVEKLKEVNEIIKTLDPAIRGDAFKLMEGYIIGKVTTSVSEGDTGKSEGVVVQTKEEFFTRFYHDKPSDNVFLIAAYHYTQVGTTPISTDEVKQIADDVGITVPTRPDMTLSRAKRGGKSLFAKAGKGKFRPTVHGEQFFKETYQATKGTQPKESGDE